MRPSMDDLDAGLHVRLRPVVGDRAPDSRQPKAPFWVHKEKGENKECQRTTQNPLKTKKSGLTDGPKLVLDDPLSHRLHGGRFLCHLQLDICLRFFFFFSSRCFFGRLKAGFYRRRRGRRNEREYAFDGSAFVIHFKLYHTIPSVGERAQGQLRCQQVTGG